MRNNYEVINDTVVIYVYCKGDYHECLVDLEGFEKIKDMDVKWVGLMEGSSIYAIANVKTDGKKTTLRMHRYLKDAPLGTVVDHVNHNGLDNRDENLNVVGKSENAQNLSKLRSDNTSGHRGVTWHKQRQKWNAQVHINGKHYSGGLYDNLEDAAEAAESLIKEHLTYYAEIKK